MLQLITLSSLTKVFSDEQPKDERYTRFSMLKSERSSFQVALCSDEDITLSFKTEGWKSDSISSYTVEEIQSDFPAYKDSDDYFLRKESGKYPDLLVPVSNTVELKGGKWQSIWFELDSSDVSAGDYEIVFSASDDNGAEVSSKINVEVIDAQLPVSPLICTLWFHCDCLATYYNVEVFSEEHWTIIENYVKNAVSHGINFILTPLFTPPLDTEIGGERPTVQLVDVEKAGGTYKFGFDKLKRWVDMCDRCGIKYFEMSHLYTQWGAKHAPKIVGVVDGQEKKLFGWDTRAGGKEYNDFLSQFAKALVKFIDENGLRDRCYFHVSDEPNLTHYFTYKKRSNVIASLFSGFKVIDALSDIKFYKKGVVKYPIPSNDHADEFADKVKEFWTYYCCVQHKEYVSNRFFAMPSARNRILGFQLYKYNAVGFLQWGYNFWYSRYSKYAINPFEVTDAGKEFPSGDAFVVYPGKDGMPLNSLRLKVFYDAVQDFAAMKLLETKIGREKTIEIIEREADGPVTLKIYPHGNEYILRTREAINNAIKENI
ncbi:MAG: DUF4091 domain-containing protein [Clostridia bacterium]|nr:DUF4091 domain-containing protein [Clostridia bacterium]MBQ7046746.1 DUF4091 domain-containing protein [Oscillospiraceae bacterium]